MSAVKLTSDNAKEKMREHIRQNHPSLQDAFINLTSGKNQNTNIFNICRDTVVGNSKTNSSNSKKQVCDVLLELGQSPIQRVNNELGILSKGLNKIEARLNKTPTANAKLYVNANAKARANASTGRMSAIEARMNAMNVRQNAASQTVNSRIETRLREIVARINDLDDYLTWLGPTIIGEVRSDGLWDLLSKKGEVPNLKEMYSQSKRNSTARRVQSAQSAQS